MAILKQTTSAIFLGLFLSIVPASHPEGDIANAAYKPRSRRPPKTRITHTATRDTCNSQDILVTPLEPQNHIAEFGQTAKYVTPLTFAGSISQPQAATQLNLNLDLYHLGHTQAFIATVPVTQTANGKWTASLSQPLAVGLYAWVLTNNCRQSATNITLHQEFEVSAIPSAIAGAIAEAKTAEQRSQVYAASGFWYNALNEALQSDSPQTLTDLMADLENLETTDMKAIASP